MSGVYRVDRRRRARVPGIRVPRAVKIRSIMELVAENSADHDVNFMIGAVLVLGGARWCG
jgi:hypothetical protein